MKRIAIAIIAFVAFASVGCFDPYKDNLIDELGEEQDGFEPSKIHRPGQPCLACHSEYEGDEPLMTFGGTIFAEPVAGAELVLLEGFIVRLIDSEGQQIDVETNQCGNFFLTKEQYDPAYPVRAEIHGTTPDNPLVTQLRPMSTRISREGSCGGCHIHPASPFSPGVAFVPRAYLPPVVSPPLGCPTPSFSDPI